MKLYRPSAYHLYGFLIAIPVIDWIFNQILYGERVLTEVRIWLYSFPLIFGLGLLAWYLHYQYEHWCKASFPGLQQTGRRLAAGYLVNILIMTPSVLGLFYLYHSLHILDYRFHIDDLKWGLLLGVVINLVFETLWEVVYIIEKYKESLSEHELFQQENIDQEFEHLKSQVNPHFLFNCFNTLSSLIAEDRERASTFLDELSKVYRYLLHSNTDGVSTLQSEVKFIQSYLQLLKTRHGDALQVSLEIDKGFHSLLVPSFSLQLLVENAVKHNIVSRQQPLTIEIFTTPARQLVVNNNLQRKQQKERSTRIGLNNIRSKYQLMNEEGFQIVEGENHFMAVLPLLKNIPANPF